MTAIGDLVRCTDGTTIVRPPECCANGHQLGPRRVLVGHQPCGCDQRGGHTTWTCNQCGDTTYAPPLAPACQPLNAAAAVR